MGEATTAIDALKRAIELENQGENFYNDAAARTVDPTGKDMFRHLAQDESNHRATVQKQLDALTSGQGWIQDTGGHKTPPPPDQPLLPPTKEAMKQKISGHADDIEALHFALDFEYRSFTFYSDAAGQVSDPAGQAMYRYLAGLEQSHFNLLMLNYENLATYGRYMGVSA